MHGATKSLTTSKEEIVKYSYLHDRPMNYIQAKKACEIDTKKLPFVESVAEYAKLLSVINSTRIGYTVWLSIRKRQYPQWTWVAESQYIKGMPNFSPTSECGFIDYNSPHLRRAPCSSLWLGYICQPRKATESCTTFQVGVKQVRVGNRCFRIYLEKVNWYEAQWRCHMQGMELAVLQDSEEAAELRDGIRNNWDIFDLSYFWIGFFKADWVDGYSNKSITDHGVFWGWTQPSHRGDCAVVESSGHNWRSANCSERHHVVCQDRTKDDILINENAANISSSPTSGNKYSYRDETSYWSCVVVFPGHVNAEAGIRTDLIGYGHLMQ